MQPGTRVLIVGAGIGGLTSAIALRRHGFDVQVIEREPEWSVYGVGILQQANVMRAVAQIGLLDDYLAAGFGFDAVQIFDAQGVHRAEVPMRHNFERPEEVTGLWASEGRIGIGLLPLSKQQMYLYLTTAEPGNPHYRQDELARSMRAKLEPARGARRGTGAIDGSRSGIRGLPRAPRRRRLPASAPLPRSRSGCADRQVGH